MTQVWRDEIFGEGYKPDADCDGAPCETFIVEIGNHKIQSRSTPEVFISGAVHGNERVGPTVAFYLIELLSTRYTQTPTTDIEKSVKYLVDNRRIVITPMTNAHGYFQHKREERLIDVNRDFPYSFPK